MFKIYFRNIVRVWRICFLTDMYTIDDEIQISVEKFKVRIELEGVLKMSKSLHKVCVVGRKNCFLSLITYVRLILWQACPSALLRNITRTRTFAHVQCECSGSSLRYFEK
jgi:hypothetical protein